MFTKQHYEAIAQIVKEATYFDSHRRDYLCSSDELIGKLADFFEADNELFNRDKFLQSCKEG